MSTETANRNTIETTTPEVESNDALLGRHQRERRAAIERAKPEVVADGMETLIALNTEALVTHCGALAHLEQQLAAALQTDHLYVLPVHGGLPSNLEIQLRHPKEAGSEGERTIIVMVPRPDHYSYAKCEAFAVLDEYDVVWG